MKDYEIIWSRAPLRLGLAGGGTDVAPYSDLYGGRVLNSTINLYAYASIEPTNDGKITFESFDLGIKEKFSNSEYIAPKGRLALLKGVYNRIVNKYASSPLSFKLSTFVDAPPGSGLGTSSTLVVAILGAFVDWLGLPLGEYEIAHESYEIERLDLRMSGGKQDQYAATFGGFNFMEFSDNNKVIVNPLRIRQETINTLEISLMLYHIGTSRLSSKIIDSMKKNVDGNNEISLEALHLVKKHAIMMKESILTSNLQNFSKIMNEGWESKKRVAHGITNSRIDKIYNSALEAGASAGRISGAGGGGFMLFFCEPKMRYKVIDMLGKLGGQIRGYNFVKTGLITWRI